VELIAEQRRLYPVGRLDADSSGLILLTNDGDLANRLTHPRYGVPKTYRARVAGGPVSESALAALRRGVVLEDGPTAPARARRVGRGGAELELSIREGRNRQVRRMCEAVGHPVLALRRVALGPLRLGGLEPGEHRRLDAAEVEQLRAAGSLSEGSAAEGSGGGGGERRGGGSRGEVGGGGSPQPPRRAPARAGAREVRRGAL
jgi:23S rRNA pseudouridine2605 synthase